MSNASERIRFRCPNCDHPIVTVPEDFEIDGTLICPGCGTTVEPPGDQSMLDKAEAAFTDLFRRKNGGSEQ